MFVANSLAATLDPYTGGGPEDRRAVGSVYEPLLQFDYASERDYRAEGKVIPWLAESWQQSDQRTYLFKIRRGVQWHDGAPFTAHDVVFSYERMRQPTFRARKFMSGLDTIEAVDDYTVRITANSAPHNFLSDLAEPNAMILPRHVADRGDDFKKVTIGTGAMKLKSYDSTKASVLERNPNYWQKGQPYVDGSQAIAGLDQSGRVAAFVAGKSDQLGLPDRRQAEPIMKQVPNVKVVTTMATFHNNLLLQLGAPPFDDVRVRRAIHLAVDRQGMNRVIAGGEGVINPPVLSGIREGYGISQQELLQTPGFRSPKDQDLAEARRLLADAGYAQGLKLTIAYGQSRGSSPPVAEAMQEQLRRAGIEATLEPKETGAYNKAESEGGYQGILSFVGGERDDLAWDYLRSGAPLNKFGLKDPELDALIDAMNASFDLEARKQSLRRIQLLLLDRAYAIPTIDWPAYHLQQAWVHDYFVKGGSSQSFFDSFVATRVWLDVDQMPADRR